MDSRHDEPRNHAEELDLPEQLDDDEEAAAPAGGPLRFARMTGSKSNTLIASLGDLIRRSGLSGAHISGSGSLVPGLAASPAKAENPPAAHNGLAARNCRNLRRSAA